MEKKTVKELVTTHPNVFGRRHEIILALCKGMKLSEFHRHVPDDVAKIVVNIANGIIERTEQ